MLAAAESVGAWVLSDEMYRLLESAEETRLPPAVDEYEKAVSLSGMSKAFGLAGLRIGWMVTHDQGLLEKMAALKDYTTICSSAPAELLALMALRSRERILRVHRDRVRRNVESAAQFFTRHVARFRWVPPQGGTVCFPRLLPGGEGTSVPGVERTDSPEQLHREGTEAFCARILRDTGVLLLPSIVYDYGDEHFRLGLGRDDFAEGLNVLDAYLNDGCG